MSTPRLTEIVERELSGFPYLATIYDAAINTGSPKQISITTGAKKAVVKITVKAKTAATVALNTGLVIGTGGSANEGTSVAFAKRDQANTATPLTVVKQDYVLGSSGSAGTAVITDYVNPDDEITIKFKLKESTAYGLVFTPLADGGTGHFYIELYEA
jgi:L,D-peptidoglycan transpeptidase YkuD (ErfK/YbiS/YcfS/YnhG family)